MTSITGAIAALTGEEAIRVLADDVQPLESRGAGQPGLCCDLANWPRLTAARRLCGYAVIGFTFRTGSGGSGLGIPLLAVGVG